MVPNTNLSKYVPYELLLDINSKKLSKAGDIELDFAVRKLFDMKEVIYDQKWVNRQEKNFDLYYMYRDLTRTQDKEIFQENNVRFDVTVIPPQTLGSEFVKTAGHFHPDAKEGVGFPEVYELMFGEGIYLLQKDSIENNIIEIMIVKAKAGDQILIPPGYGHITINPSKTETLVMNNLVSSAFSSIYGSIKEKQGAAYLLLNNGSWIKNDQYTEEINILKREPEKIVNKPFYLSFIESPDKWIYLNEPWTKKNW